ncbi:MAG: RNA pseudouridine synthase [Treponema sp.]|nr:RNA pseudouridine synthase [Treponema sp.]
MKQRIEVLFENHECVVLNKPAGLPVQGGRGVSSSLDAILQDPRGRLGEIHLEKGTRLLLVHRLDKDTSGALLAAKGHEAAAKFSALFASGERGGQGAREVQKRYLAVSAGRPSPEPGVIRTSLDIRGKSKTAETSYARLSGGPLLDDAAAGGRSYGLEFSVLELELGTGRMHQIRRHLQEIGCPILGDDKYGDFALNKALRKQGAVKRLLLHASRLVVSDTVPGCNIDVSAPLPEYFARFFIHVLQGIGAQGDVVRAGDHERHAGGIPVFPVDPYRLRLDQ